MEEAVLSPSEEEKIKKTVKKVIEETCEEYIKILKEIDENKCYPHTEGNVKNLLYFNLRRRIKSKRLEGKLHKIIINEFPLPEGRKIDFGIYNLEFDKKEKTWYYTPNVVLEIRI